MSFLAFAFSSQGSLTADVILENWEFNDANNTALNAVANTGTTATSWNFGGPRTQNGNLNIGDTSFFKFDVGTAQTFRTANFAALTSGQFVFEFVISDWDLSGSEGETGNGIKFNFGDSALGRAQIEFEVAQNAGDDIRVRSQNSNNGNLSGTDAQNQLGGLDLDTTAPVTVQLVADLDTGLWSTQFDSGNGFVDLVTDGAGLNSINQIQLITDGGLNGWAFDGTVGVANDFVTIDSISLTQIVSVPEPTSFGLIGLAGIGLLMRRRSS